MFEIENVFIVLLFWAMLSSAAHVNLDMFRKRVLKPIPFWIMIGGFLGIYYYIEFVLHEVVLANACNAYTLIHVYFHTISGGRFIPYRKRIK